MDDLTEARLPPRGQRDAAESPLVLLENISKAYGPTQANRDVTFRVAPGEVVGLIGANGAGKSTLMRILTGGTGPDTGTLVFDGAPVEWGRFGPRACHALGIRIVHQELSLCPNLTAAENFYLEQPERRRLSPLWLGPYRRAVRDSMAAVFPGMPVDPDARVGRLDIGERQMLEIARAAHDPRLRLLILDEPTSSLSSEQARALHAHVARRAAEGLAIIFISHKLQEVLGVADRIVAMRNGAVVSDRLRAETSLDDLIEAVGGRAAAAHAHSPARDAGGPVLVRLSGRVTEPLGRPVELRAGEVVGLAGLEGGGQKALLRRLFAPAAARGGETGRTGRAAFVSGDRRGEGVFPLWSVLDNVTIGRVARQHAASPVRLGAERAAASAWAGRIALAPERLPDPILDLSGGNQQKALLARGMALDAPIILLDDPTRGVDIGAKRDFYRTLRAIAGEGRLAIWHSTEDAELLECDRVLVLSHGRIVADLAGEAVTEEAIIGHGFVEPERVDGARRRRLLTPERVFEAVPFLGLALLVALMANINPLVLSSFGMQLLLGPAVVLVLVALAQMFVVGGSEIDLGVGGFVSMVNVISATLLVTQPGLGAAMLAGGLAGYALLAILIQTRGIPAIVVTLGASFIWIGIGRTIQPSPGGSAPDWLREAFTWQVPFLPTPLALILAAGVVALAIDRSPIGVVLRGFGSAPEALDRLGWPPLRYAIWRYLIAGCFALTAGLYLTATNQASDINVGSAYTLLSVAGVVIGGCALLGGFISPLGVVAGAVTLALIGAALAMLGVGTDYNALVQGSLLILILGLRTLLGWRRGDAG
jgi:ribose transport system ATP-binding protein